MWKSPHEKFDIWGIIVDSCGEVLGEKFFDSLVSYKLEYLATLLALKKLKMKIQTMKNKE